MYNVIQNENKISYPSPSFKSIAVTTSLCPSNVKDESFLPGFVCHAFIVLSLEEL